MSAAPPFAPNCKTVLVMNGLTSVGREIALAFARHGALLVLTCKPGRDEQTSKQRLAEFGAPEPLLIDSDDPGEIFPAIKARCGPIDALIGNPPPAYPGVRIRTIEDYDEGEFAAALRAAAWPLVDFAVAARKHLGRYPRYVVALSAETPDRFVPGRDFAACGAAATETLVRHLAYRLCDDGVRVNAVRSPVLGASENADIAAADRLAMPRPSTRDVANAVLALCSGMFDGMTGQILTVDRGEGFIDGISIVYEREALGR
jgi:NAD(P)-dependent dehydrogenase (short-subunit alcohol dehydrogenase family)